MKAIFMKFCGGPRVFLQERAAVLLEVVLAMVIVTVAMTAMIQSLTQALRSTVLSASYTRAVWLAENKLATLVAQGVSVPPSPESGLFSQDPGYAYQLSFSKVEREKIKSPNLYETTLSVSWPLGANERKLFFTTYLPAAAKDQP